jgi:hypothetical protein
VNRRLRASQAKLLSIQVSLDPGLSGCKNNATELAAGMPTAEVC